MSPEFYLWFTENNYGVQKEQGDKLEISFDVIKTQRQVYDTLSPFIKNCIDVVYQKHRLAQNLQEIEASRRKPLP